MLHHHEPPYYLNSGELLFSTDGCSVRTVLGSCVGVAVYDPVLRIGGLCHYLLPEAPGDGASTKYGNVALPYLFQRFKKAGSQRKDLRAWIAGGAILLDAQEIFFVGDRNADFAEAFLSDLGVKVVGNDTRGYRGRKVSFDTAVGHFHCEYLGSRAIKDLLVI